MKTYYSRGLCAGFALALLALSPPVSAQQTSKPGADLSGAWINLVHSPGFKGKQSEWTTQPLRFTPTGLAAFQANHPGKGPRGFEPDHDNDPIRGANPTGLYRTMIYFRAMEFVQTPEQVMQVFELGKNWRSIHTDGRPVPKEVAAGPYWYGYSVGHWEGDMLVVSTIELDERAWLDEWGTPISQDARVEERWQRVSPEKLQLKITVTDPAFYTKPWTSDPLIFIRLKGVQPEEIISAPIDEKEFDQHLRAPASGIKK